MALPSQLEFPLVVTRSGVYPLDPSFHRAMAANDAFDRMNGATRAVPIESYHELTAAALLDGAPDLVEIARGSVMLKRLGLYGIGP
jgi:hypothetical protein